MPKKPERLDIAEARKRRDSGWKFDPASLYQVLGPQFPKMPRRIVYVGDRPYVATPPERKP